MASTVRSAPRRRVAPAVAALAFLLAPAAAQAFSLPERWPADPAVEGRPVEIDSRSPFVPGDIAADAPPATAQVTWFAPRNRTAGDGPAPAVVLLHGAAGVQRAREITYARQLAAMGIGAAVVDVFAARRDLARGFSERIVEITETMALADAYATLRWLDARPGIDGRRVALWGFSYGAMASVFGANAEIARRFAALYDLGATRFAGHIAFYGPCLASFEAPETTGAPVLMAWGAEDELIDAARCEALAQELREGGSRVETVVFEGAYHQWDGGRSGPYRIGRLLDDCRFHVDADLGVWSPTYGIPMMGALTRKAILGLCVGSQGYLIGRDPQVRARSNRLVGRFLERIFAAAGAS